MLIQEILKIYRKQNNYTQEQVATKLHVSTQAVSKWEQGLSIPSIDNLLMLSDLYDVAIDELLQGSPYFKKPLLIGKKFDYRKGISFVLLWTLLSFLATTSIGYPSFLLYILLWSVGFFVVLPTIYLDYWTIEKDCLEIQHYSEKHFKKLAEMLRGKAEQKIPYNEINSVKIVYRKRRRLSPFDNHDDDFYLLIAHGQERTRLNLINTPADYLPQFTAFLARQGIEIIDDEKIIELLIVRASLFHHFHPQQIDA